MTREEKQFDDLIFEHYGQKDMFDKIKHNFWTVRTNLLIHDGFKNLFPKSQFNICATVINMSNHTSLEALRQFSIRKDKNEIFEYSINLGYQEPSKFDLKVEKLYLPEIV